MSIFEGWKRAGPKHRPSNEGFLRVQEEILPEKGLNPSLSTICHLLDEILPWGKVYFQ